jgi:uncharacterized protein (DUF58 family)
MRRLIPSRALVLFSAAPLLASLLALFNPTLVRAALYIDAGLVALALIDGLLSLRLKVSVQRFAPDVMSLSRRNRVSLRLRSERRGALRVSLTDDLFEGALASDLPLTVKLKGRGVPTVIDYHVEPSLRGAHALGDHHLRMPSPLGLWTVQRRIPANKTIRVYPDLKQLQQFDLLSKQDRELSLVRVSRHKGGESEFARLRDHVPDDDSKRVDWKATARRQKLTVREYQLESNQNLMFLLDAGRVMTGVDGSVSRISRFDHALNASLMLAHVAARGGDRVGVLGFDDTLRVFMTPQAGRQASRAIIQATYDLFPRLVEPDFDLAFQSLATRVKNRTLVILFTHVIDFSAAETLVRRVRAIGRRHLPLIIGFRDLEVEALADPRGKADLYLKGAAAEHLRWQKSLMKDLKRGGALVLETTARELTGKLVSRYLEIKAQKLL